MVTGRNGPRWPVRLSVPRRGGWRAWRAVSGDFERRLAGQQSAAVIAPQIEGEIRRGKDYVRVAIVMTIAAADVADAPGFAWRVFRQAAGDDIEGWDMAAVSAEVRPGGG